MSQSSQISQPRILVPDSSPSASPVAHVYKPHAGHGVPTKRPGGTPAQFKGDDLLVASKFQSVGGPDVSSMMNGLVKQSLSRSSSSKDVRPNGNASDRPRKRLNTGASTPAEAPIVISSSPASSIAASSPPRRPGASTSTSHESTPQIVDARQQLAAVRIRSSAPSEVGSERPDSEESAQSTSKKVVRGRARDASPEVMVITSSPARPGAEPSPLDILRSYAPKATEEQLLLVLSEVDGDVEAAKERLQQEREYYAQRHRNVAAAKIASSTPPSPVVAKGKGNKKSAIYAKRQLVTQNTAGPSQSTPQRSATPNQKRKRPTTGSDDESGIESDGSARKGKGRSDSDTDSENEDEDPNITADQEEAVRWFDSAPAEELMELTCMSSRYLARYCQPHWCNLSLLQLARWFKPRTSSV